MFKLGVRPSRLRTAPPTLNSMGAESLGMAMRAWPRWFARCCDRLQGLRTVAQFGLKAVMPHPKQGETWEHVFRRECIENAPPFVRERATAAMNRIVSTHAHHARTPFPDVQPCRVCIANAGSWKKLALALYNGDPLASKTSSLLPNLEEKISQPWRNDDAHPWMRGDNLSYREWKERAGRFR